MRGTRGIRGWGGVGVFAHVRASVRLPAEAPPHAQAPGLACCDSPLHPRRPLHCSRASHRLALTSQCRCSTRGACRPCQPWRLRGPRGRGRVALVLGHVRVGVIRVAITASVASFRLAPLHAFPGPAVAGASCPGQPAGQPAPPRGTAHAPPPKRPKRAWGFTATRALAAESTGAWERNVQEGT